MNVSELSKVITDTRITLAKMGASLDNLTRNVQDLQKDIIDIKSQILGIEKRAVTKNECQTKASLLTSQNNKMSSIRDKIIGGIIVGSAIISIIVTLFKDSIVKHVAL